MVSGEIVVDDDALEVARKAVEDVLIEFRDNGVFVLVPNGFVIRYRDGSLSDVMRLSTRDGLRVGIKAYLAATGVGR